MLRDITLWAANALKVKQAAREESLAGDRDGLRDYLTTRGIADVDAFRSYFEAYSGIHFQVNSNGDEVRFRNSSEQIAVFQSERMRALAFATQSRTHLMYALREDGSIIAVGDGFESMSLFSSLDGLVADLEIAEQIARNEIHSWSVTSPSLAFLSRAALQHGLTRMSDALSGWWANDDLAISTGRCRAVRCPYKRRFNLILFWRPPSSLAARSFLRSIAPRLEPHVLLNQQGDVNLTKEREQLYGFRDSEPRLGETFRAFVSRELGFSCDPHNETEFHHRLANVELSPIDCKRAYLVALGHAAIGVKERLLEMLEVMPSVPYEGVGWEDFGWGIESLNLLISRFHFCLPQDAAKGARFLRSIWEDLKWDSKFCVYGR